MRSTQLIVIRRLVVLALLVTLTFIPITDTIRAESNHHHLYGYPDGRVNTSVLNVRSGPGLGYRVVGYGAWSEAIYVSRQAYGCSWLEVSLADGTSGWVYRSLVELYKSCAHFTVAHYAVMPTATPVPQTGGHYHSSGHAYQAPDGSHHYDPGVTNRTAGGYHLGYNSYKPQPQPQPHYGKSGYRHNPYGYTAKTSPPAVSSANRYVNLLRPTSSDLRGMQEFAWQPTAPLGPGEAYELVFWRPGQDPMVSGFSPFEATTATSVLIDLDESIRRIGQLQSGFDYVWGVLLVRTSPYQRVASLTTGHQFRLEFLFNSSSNGGGGGSNTPTNTPRPGDPTSTPTQQDPVERPTPVPITPAPTRPPLGTFTPVP